MNRNEVLILNRELSEKVREVDETKNTNVTVFILPPDNRQEYVGQLLESFKGKQQPKGVIQLDTVDGIDWGVLTSRELAVLNLMIEGLENRDIASLLKISDKTVKNHVSSILEKLNVKNRTQAVVLAFKTHYAQIT